MNSIPARGFTVERIRMVYQGSAGPVHALDPISFRMEAGEFVCLVGPSGCGKSTLLKILAGLIRPSGGEVRFDGEEGPLSNALVFQEHSLFPWMTVQENVAFGLEMQGVGRAERNRRALDFLRQVGLSAFGKHFPHELSVGMSQRAAIARAVLSDPQLLLMDEPFSALDAQSRLVLQEELLHIWKMHRKTVLFVTHDIGEAVLLGDRVMVMSGRPGRIQMDIQIPLGRPRDLHDLDQPEVRQIEWRIWKAIEGEVRQNLHLPS